MNILKMLVVLILVYFVFALESTTILKKMLFLDSKEGRMAIKNFLKMLVVLILVYIVFALESTTILKKMLFLDSKEGRMAIKNFLIKRKQHMRENYINFFLICVVLFLFVECLKYNPKLILLSFLLYFYIQNLEKRKQDKINREKRKKINS